MKRSTDRILTTHTGSLPRPRDLITTLEALDAGTPPDPAAFARRVRDAVADVVAKQHLCWGNYEGPHHRDVPLREILPIVLRARAGAISLEGANPRHAHEWTVFREIKLPDDKILIPGVLDSTTNFIEHPELVAQRIVRYAGVVGRERVIAGSDCGFGTFARSTPQVEPEIVWAKLAAMAEGARLASAELWRNR